MSGIRIPDGDLNESCDVVVVGSGAGGATMAASLAEAGVDVVVLEEGGHHSTVDYGTRLAPALRTLYRDGGAQAAIGTPPVLYSEGRCVGGSTVVNGGMSFRTPDAALDRWGLSAEEMRPYFETVERRLHVAHQDPETIGRDSQLLKAGADTLGWRLIPNTRNQIHCAGSNNCTLGCPTGAKRSMLLTHIPRALGYGARVYAGCRVDRITRRGNQVTGILGRSSGGVRRHTIRISAPVVVVAGGAVQTPALLMRSGFRSPSGQLGRNLAMHPNAKLVAIFDEDVRGWQGVHQAYQVRQFADEGILITVVNVPPALVAMGLPDHGPAVRELMGSYDRMVTAGCLIEDTGTGSVRNVPGLGAQAFYQISERDAHTVVRGIALTAELLFAAGARRILAPFPGAPDLSTMDDLRNLLSRPVPARSLELFTVHLMGTARMGDVVSSYGEFHGARGLFVADASLFPGPIGVNPMETIVALVLRNADWLVAHRKRYGI